MDSKMNHTMMMKDDIKNPMDSSGDMGTMGHMGDMGGMKMNGTHTMMKMWFHFGFNDYLLFKPWLITNAQEMVAAFFGVFIMAALYEGLKILREVMLTKYSRSVINRSGEHSYQMANGDTTQQGDSVRIRGSVVRGYRNDENRGTEEILLTSSSDISFGKTMKRRLPILSLPHLLQTILHMVQVLISYFLMLIFMTYNVWLCLGVILGAGTGYFVFSWRRTVLLEDLTEHCH